MCPLSCLCCGLSQCQRESVRRRYATREGSRVIFCACQMSHLPENQVEASGSHHGLCTIVIGSDCDVRPLACCVARFAPRGQVSVRVGCTVSTRESIPYSALGFVARVDPPKTFVNDPAGDGGCRYLFSLLVARAAVALDGLTCRPSRVSLLPMRILPQPLNHFSRRVMLGSMSHTP